MEVSGCMRLTCTFPHACLLPWLDYFPSIWHAPFKLPSCLHHGLTAVRAGSSLACMASHTHVSTSAGQRFMTSSPTTSVPTPPGCSPGPMQ